MRRATARNHDRRSRVAILVPTGMLGAGFPTATIDRGIELGADAIAVDAGSTDSGPFYLGTGQAKTTTAQVEHDLRVLLLSAVNASIPLLIGSCGTSGTDSGVNWIAGMARRIASEAHLAFTLACIYSEQDADDLVTALNDGLIRPLAPARALSEATLKSCSHIVGLMGHEPISAALRAGADVVLAGRATDTAVIAAVALDHGLPAGPTWHGAKTVECGGMCTTNPTAGGVLLEIDHTGFTVTPLDAGAACTPTSIAAHMLYENANPFELREPPGTLDTTDATYRALDARVVRVEGSVFEPADTYTIKLEGSAPVGYETVTIVGIRNPAVIADIETWTDFLTMLVDDRVSTVLGVARDAYDFDVSRYGYDAVLGPLEPEHTSHEIGILFRVRAGDQATATAIAKVANPMLLHLPLPHAKSMPSFAFPFSPAEIERGAAYEFVLNHTVAPATPTSMFRTEITATSDA
ncbi:MAG: hypothetical protein JWL83_4289 [Actinomycetia bacterium]|nr:hypothetical protein [Actinomycetes bacterium]